MPTVTGIAPDVYRISTYEPRFKLQYNQFLVKDKEPPRGLPRTDDNLDALLKFSTGNLQ